MYKLTTATLIILSVPNILLYAWLTSGEIYFGVGYFVLYLPVTGAVISLLALKIFRQWRSHKFLNKIFMITILINIPSLLFGLYIAVVM